MTLWDVLALCVAAAFVVEGLFRGAVRLGFGLMGLLAGYLFAGRVAPLLTDRLGFVPGAVRFYAAVAMGFGLIVLVAVVVGYLLHRLVKAGGLGVPNRVLGAVLGLVVACYLAGGLQHFARSRSPGMAQDLDGSPVFSVMAKGALLVEELFGPQRVLPMAQPRTDQGDRA